MQTQLHDTSDLCIHGIHIAIFYLETTADYERIQKVILGPLSTTTQLETVFPTMKVQQTDNLNTAVDMLLGGTA